MQRGWPGIKVPEGGHTGRVLAIKISLELSRVGSGGDERDCGGALRKAYRLV